MKFTVKAEYLSTDEFEIEAETAEEAEQKFMNGECDEGHNTDYALNQIISVKEV